MLPIRGDENLENNSSYFQCIQNLYFHANVADVSLRPTDPGLKRGLRRLPGLKAGSTLYALYDSVSSVI